MDVAPRDVRLRFQEGQVIDPTTLVAQLDPDPDDNVVEFELFTSIEVIRAGGDGTFGDGNEVDVQVGFIGIGEADNEVVIRFAENLPDDHYIINVFGDADAHRLVLRNDANVPLNDPADPDVDTDDPPDGIPDLSVDNGSDFSLGFELDLGAQIVSVVPQPLVDPITGGPGDREPQQDRRLFQR